MPPPRARALGASPPWFLVLPHPDCSNKDVLSRLPVLFPLADHLTLAGTSQEKPGDTVD